MSKDIPLGLSELDSVFATILGLLPGHSRYAVIRGAIAKIPRTGSADQKLLYLLPRLHRVWEDEKIGECGDKKTWVEELMAFYQELPDACQEERPIPGQGYEKFRGATLVRSKQWILEQCAHGWRWNKMPGDEKNIAIFRFLCDVVDANAHSHRQYFGDDRTTRYVSDDEKETVINKMRPHSPDSKDVAAIEWWLQTQKSAPAPVLEMLAMARAKAGGVALAIADAHRRQLFEPLASEGGIRLSNEYVRQLGSMETWMHELMDRMQPWQKRNGVHPNDSHMHGVLQFDWESDKVIVLKAWCRNTYGEDKDEWRVNALDKARSFIGSAPEFSGNEWTLNLEIVFTDHNDPLRWSTTIGKKKE